MRIGNQTPTHCRLPVDMSNTELGDIAIEFATSVGYLLHPWQEFTIRSILSRSQRFETAIVLGDPTPQQVRLWSARDCVLEMPRQNGKNVVLQIIELTLLFLCGFRYIVHSAHRAKTAHDHFRDLKRMIENSPDLMDAMPTHRKNQGFTTANGKEAIELASGARIEFQTRSAGGGRGPSPQVIVFDEAYWLTQESIGTMSPSTSAQPNPLLIYTSSAPRADSRSKTLHGLRRRCVDPDPEDDRFLYIGWGSDPDVDRNDRDNWYRCNPSLGLTKYEASIVADMKLMADMPGEFEAEHLGVPQEELAEQTVVALDVWDALVDADSTATSKWSIGLAVSEARDWASFGAAGRRDDNLIHVEIPSRGRRPGTGWVVDRAVELHDKFKVPIRIVKTSPAGSMIESLREAGVEVEELSDADLAKGTGNFIDWANGTPPDENGEGAIDPQLVHLGSKALRSALAGAVVVKAGDAKKWSLTRSVGEVTPLVAVTLALGGVPQIVRKKKKPGVLVR